MTEEEKAASVARFAEGNKTPMSNRMLTDAEKFQAELNELLAKYPTVKLIVTQSITISEKQ